MFVQIWTLGFHERQAGQRMEFSFLVDVVD